MKLRDVLRNVEIIYKTDNFDESIEIENLSEETNNIRENTCFICIKGSNTDSHNLLNTFNKLPVVIIAERQIDTAVPYILVRDTKKVIPSICFNFFQNPSQKLTLLGVTGTDGKTTTALVLKQLIDSITPCAYIGTNGFIVKDNYLANKLTTPKAITLNSYLKTLVDNFISYATLEVSSQGLDTDRVNTLTFKGAIFTNLTHEHLDHHKTIENYFLTKLKLFQMLEKDSCAIINLDSPYAQRIIDNTIANVLTYGQDINSCFRISNIRTNINETFFDLATPQKFYKDIKTNLFGDYNVYNITSSLAMAHFLGFNIEELIPILREIKQIEGRMVNINCGQPFSVIVDFAHTPNALNSILSNLAKFKKNNLSVIFGSAGERDKTKRPIMGEVVEKYATEIIITNEDPKSEEPLDIIKDIYKGIKNTNLVKIIPNRKEAIIKVLDNAKENDIIVITGKGNEKCQVFKGYLIDHNDIDTVKTFLLEKYQRPFTYSIANM